MNESILPVVPGPAEVAVGDFERFLLAGKGASAATQQCYLRHVQAMLAELATRRA